METAQDKTICLLEQHMVCSDPATVHVMNIMNRCMYGRDNMLIKDDMLCALWIRQEKEYVQHWLVRPLYERYGQEGWQSILPEISTGLTDREEEAPFVGGTLSYAACRSHMIIRPMNFARYQQDLGNAVYRKIEIWRWYFICWPVRSVGAVCSSGPPAIRYCPGGFRSSNCLRKP